MSIFLIAEIEFDGEWAERSRWELDAIAYLIGRSQVCDIVVDFVSPEVKASISKVHCCLLRRHASAKDKYGKYLESGYDLVDGFRGVPSRNGVKMGGKRIEGKVGLKHGDGFAIAQGLRFRYHSPKESLTANLDDTLIDPQDLG